MKSCFSDILGKNTDVWHMAEAVLLLFCRKEPCRKIQYNILISHPNSVRNTRIANEINNLLFTIAIDLMFIDYWFYHLTLLCVLQGCFNFQLQIIFWSKECNFEKQKNRKILNILLICNLRSHVWSNWPILGKKTESLNQRVSLSFFQKRVFFGHKIWMLHGKFYLHSLFVKLKAVSNFVMCSFLFLVVSRFFNQFWWYFFVSWF